MIISSLNCMVSNSVYPDVIRKALDYISKTDFLSMPTGRYDLAGDEMFVNLMDMTTHPFEGSHPEVHKKYIDLMYWPEGGERIGYAPFLGTERVFESHPENDITLLEDVSNESIITTTMNQFCVFFPWDAHRPGIMLGESPATSKKVVIKISMDLI